MVGVYSDALSDSLQAKSDLSLKKAIELSRQAEARKHNREYVRENTAATNKTVDYVKPAHAINKHKKPVPKAKNYPTADSSTTTRTHSCKWCGRSRHDRRHCPAREAICRNCQRKGHFHSVCRGEKVVNRVNEVQQLGSVDLPYLGYVGAKCDNKHIFVEIDVPYSGDNGENCADEQISAEIDVPYSGDNGENCADEQISAQIDVPYSGDNGENCADEQISAQIDVPYSGDNGENCADEQISAQIDVPYSGNNGENCADEHISAQIDVPYSGDNGENCADEKISAEIDVPFLGYVGAKCDAEHWSAEIEVNGHDTKFKLDTGAGVSVVSDRETWLQSENLLTTKHAARSGWHTSTSNGSDQGTITPSK